MEHHIKIMIYHHQTTNHLICMFRLKACITLMCLSVSSITCLYFAPQRSSLRPSPQQPSHPSAFSHHALPSPLRSFYDCCQIQIQAGAPMKGKTTTYVSFTILHVSFKACTRPAETRKNDSSF